MYCSYVDIILYLKGASGVKYVQNLNCNTHKIPVQPEPAHNATTYYSSLRYFKIFFFWGGEVVVITQWMTNSQ